LKRKCGICGAHYTGNRKIDHVKRSHRIPAYEQFESVYIRGQLCDVCDGYFEGNVARHIGKKHLGRAAKEFVEALK
jgi:hypothetical protein